MLIDTSAKPYTIRQVRQLRQAADILDDNADQHRVALIAQLGLKRYLFSILGPMAHRPAHGTRLLWPDRTERIDDTTATLGEWLCRQAQQTLDLPQAVLTDDGQKYYL